MFRPVHDGGVERIGSGLGALVFVLGLTAAACTASDSPAEVARIGFGELPSVMVPEGDYMWALDRRGNTIAKVDVEENAVVDEFRLEEKLSPPDQAWDIAAVDGSLWITAPTSRRLYELDTATGRVLSTVRTRGHTSDVHVAAGSLWFEDDGKRGVDLVRLDPETGRKEATFRFGPQNTDVGDVVEFDRSVWVVRNYARFVGGPGPVPTFYMTAELWRIDPVKDRVMNRLDLGSTYHRGGPNPIIGDVEVAEDGLWLSRVHERRIALVAPDDGTVLKQFDIGVFERPWEFAFADGYLWVGDLNTPEIVRIDPDTREREFIDVGRETSFIGSGFGSVWIPLYGDPPDGGLLVRMD
jgi:streptogramin lyase